MTTEKCEKSLLINVSKDEMNTIDEILQSRQPEMSSDKKTGKLPVAPRSFNSGSGKLSFPVSVLMQASGALIELNSNIKQSETAEVTASDEEKDGKYSIEIPECLEDLILLEHNYAVKYCPTLKRTEDENAMETEAHEKCDIKEVPETSIISEAPTTSKNIGVSEISNISEVPQISSISEVSQISNIPEVPEISSFSPPIRRSKRQIERLVREQVAAANVDALDHEISKEKLVKHEDKKSDDKEAKSLKIETNLSSDIKVSNYKSFAEFKKRHLKVMVEDCKNVKGEDGSIPAELSITAEEILNDSIDNKDKNDTTLEDKNIHNLKPETLTRSKYPRKTKVFKSSDVESDEKSSVHVPLKRKKKILKSTDLSPVKSSESEEKLDKSLNKNALKEKKKTIEQIKQKNLSSFGKKRKKHVSSSEKLTSNADVHQSADSPRVGKRKKCVSFSDDLLSGDKPEVISRKQRISSDSKESLQKGAINSPVASTTPVPKVHKKKILRRDSLRLINDDGPALFSQPDVMIKVSADDNANKKDEKESDSSDRQNKGKTADMPAVKNSSKENNEMKEKQMQKDKSESYKLSLNAKQEKEAGKVRPEEKEKQSSKLKPEEKEKQAIKKENSGIEGLKQDLKMEEDESERQTLKQGKKEGLILNQEEKARQVLKQDESEANLKEKEKQVPEALEEEHAEKHLEEGHAKEFQEEKQKDSKRHKEEKSIYSDEKSDVHQMDCSSNFQSTEENFDEQNEVQHPYNNFTNIEALLESSKFHAPVEKLKEVDSKLSKDITSSIVEDSDKNDQPEVALKTDNEDKLAESIRNTGSDGQMSSFTGINEEAKVVPERKSRRLIKKKEFFGDTSDSSDSKKISTAKNKRINIDKPIGRGRRPTLKNKNDMSKNGEMEERNGHLEQDVSSDPDSSEEDDPEKLWCICRKPHNSRFMIMCDKCEDWFHGSCVGVTKNYGRQLEKQKKEWHCPNCRQKGEPSPQKAEKSLKQAVKAESPNEKNSKTDVRDEHLTSENKKKPLLQDMAVSNSTNFENNKMCVQDEKNLRSPAANRLPSDETSLKKGKVHSNTVEKLDKDSKKVLKQPSQQKQSTHFKQNSPANLKRPDDSLKLSSSSKHSSITNTRSDVSLKSPVLPKQLPSISENASPNKKGNAFKASNRSSGKSASVFLDPKRKLSNAGKEKDVLVKKKQTVFCISCSSEARANSCYCSDECIEEYVAQGLKMLREAKGAPKGSEFDSQRLAVLDRLKGHLITNGPTPGEIVSWLKSNPSYIITRLASFKRDANTQKKEYESCSSSDRRDSSDESTKTTIRLNVRKTLKNILLERCKKADDLEMSEEDVQKIAVKIEEELNTLFKDNSFKYRAKYRSLMFNIKDPRNQGLFRKILKGNIPPDKLVRMTPEELASVELAKWREQENQHLLDMIKRVQLEQQKSGSGLLLKKTHKGEVEIEDDLTSIIEQDIPKTVLKDVPEDLVEPEKEEMKDSTHLHRSHLFDLNCKICTGKIVPPPVDENVPKKVRVAHSISVDLGSPNASETVEKSVPKVVDGKSPVSNAGDDSMDQVPTSTVTIESPEINAKSSLKDNSSKTLSSVWKGFIFMQDIAKFVTSAYKVSGPTDHLQADLPDTIQVCGRIVPDQVWDYLGKIKQSGNKELVIIRFQAANDEEAVTYHSFYFYLSSRKRYGVVSNYSKKIKDFYLLPLAATSPVPMVLVPFDGPGLPSPRPHLLLGVIVRHKFKQGSLPAVPRQLPSSKAEVEIADDSYTPPHEPRSYTPPLPTLSSDVPKEQEEKSVLSPDSAHKEDLNTYDAAVRDSDFSVEKSTTLFSDKGSVSNVLSFDKDDDKPYDPEQDILNIPSETHKARNANFSLDESKERSTVNLEQQKKILDALSREVEETENALKQLISQPEEETVVQSPNAPSLDINSVAETGMSSFLDLPENLQEILNAVRLKTYDKEVGDVDMRIKTLFGKHFNEQKNDGSQQPEILRDSSNSSKTMKSLEEVYDPQAATPPPNDDDIDTPTIACPSDPRIKLRTSFQDISFISKDTFSSNMSGPELTTNTKKHLPMEAETEVSSSMQKSKGSTTMPHNILMAGWNSGKEPPPPGIEPSESPSHESMPIQASPHTSGPPVYAATVQDTSQHVSSAFYPQTFSSFQPHLPLGFSVHTPPPNIKHFPPPPIVSTSFPPPPPLPMHVVPPQATDSNIVKDQWPALQPPSHQSEGNEWHAGSTHWKEAADHQGNQSEGDSRYYSSDRSNDYDKDNFYKRDSGSRSWDRSQRFGHARWAKNPSRGRYTNERRGKRGPSFRRNLRN